MTSAYDLLGVKSTANEATIDAAFRRAVKELHPDPNPDNQEAEEYLKQLLLARAKLEEAQRCRRMRDRQLTLRGSAKGREIFVAATLVTVSSMLVALYISYGEAPGATSFETKTVQADAWTTRVRDRIERPAPRK